MRRLIKLAVWLSVVGSLLALQMSTTAQVPSESNMPRIERNQGNYALMVDNAPFLILGAQAHNSSGWPAMMPQVWPAVKDLHANTLEIPVYWEQFEPDQGKFDFSSVDMLLSQAREHQVHLVLLWFGTWKNGSAHYRPLWMKKSPEIYPNIVDKQGKEVDSPSPYCMAAREADINAFTTLMQHLKAADAQHTVIMVQVENEPGTWGSIRDYTPAAQKLFESPVPAELLKALNLPAAADENWGQAFGASSEEFFHAYSIASYIQQVAAAGKGVYPIPLYVNVALRDPLEPGHPPSYESGGATDNVISIWKATATAIDVLAPDIYNSDSKKVFKWMHLYRRPDNALFVPEIGSGQNYVRYCYAAIGDGAIGFSPFGMDYSVKKSVSTPTDRPAPPEPAFNEMAMNYRAIGSMSRQIAKLNLEGKVQASIETETRSSPIAHFGLWDITTFFGVPPFGAVSGEAPAPGNSSPIGRALFAQLGDNEFIVTGFYCRLAFTPAGTISGKPWQFMKVEEGQYENGVFKAIRIWNGDETDWGLNFAAQPLVLHITLMAR